MNIPLIAQDKANHFIYGLLIFTVTQAAFGILIAAVVTALAAAAKEGYDFLHKDVHTPTSWISLPLCSGVLWGCSTT